MSSTQQASKNVINLKGSTEIVTEFFGYSINSILYQRGIYPPETFKPVSKYGLTMLVTGDEGLKKYLSQVLNQISVWLMEKAIQKLVIVISSVEKKTVLERWVFNVETDKTVTATSPGVQKSEKEIVSEIQAIIRQITASVTYLPLLTEPCTFDLLVYTDADCEVPQAWEESDPRYITNSQHVNLRSFTTKIHKVDAMVSYAADD
eukprot:GEZU01000323.1.p1 GENE.GEZU01000323.1~~GEZU01000323.1.p1  ORF type:complete len:234 (-),score=57.23 GEZU01000323.1:110-724(-)